MVGRVDQEMKRKRQEKKYPFPDCLTGLCYPVDFEHWLERKARAHLKRDRKRGNCIATRELYKLAIYNAVVSSGGRDAYTGKRLRWDLISKYDNDEAKNKGRNYKKEFGDLPTVDHVDDAKTTPLINICSWRVNDSKNDLTLDEFIEVCREVLEHNKK